MVATIQVNKQSIKRLLESGKEQMFLIPEYQRPYSWTENETKTLFYDLLEFTESESKKNSEVEGTYFLGSIVSYENEEGEQEIIDGQQRITSLFLLLRAIYTKLISYEEKTIEQENFIRQIQPALWKQEKLTGEVDYKSVLINSRVIDNEGNKILLDNSNGQTLSNTSSFKGDVVVAIRPENAILSDDGEITGKVYSKFYLGDCNDLRVEIGNGNILRIIARASTYNTLNEGDEVKIKILYMVYKNFIILKNPLCMHFRNTP